MLNLVEVCLQLWAIVLLSKKDEAPGALLTFLTSAFTFWKTVLYWTYDIAGGFVNTGHNTLFNLIFVYILPGSMWLIMPALVLWKLWGILLEALGGGVKAKAKRA